MLTGATCGASGLGDEVIGGRQTARRATVGGVLPEVLQKKPEVLQKKRKEKRI